MRNLMFLQSILMITFLVSGPASAAPFTASIEEIWNEEETTVEFIVTNNDEDFYITNIAVENPSATYAWSDNDFEYAFVISRDNPSATWWEVNGDFPVDWLMDDGNWLGNATRAFLYEGDFSGSTEGLGPGETLGEFYGSTETPQSQFAVRWAGIPDDPKFAGETSSVPIPGAVWLLGSGLICIVGVRRKFRKA